MEQCGQSLTYCQLILTRVRIKVSHHAEQNLVLRQPKLTAQIAGRGPKSLRVHAVMDNVKIARCIETLLAFECA